jgi:fused signal recognition particle receptor
VIAQKHGSDPGAVIYDSIASAKSHGEELILADTAGRMHNKSNLVNELKKIDKIVNSNLNGGQYRKILILDATTGQNGLQQAEVFNEAVHVDCIILTKYDATARGGLIVAINRKLNIPVAFVGHGEGLDDLSEFSPENYLDDLLALE